MGCAVANRKKRLDSSLFNLPVEEIKAGQYSDKYFVRTREILLRDQNHARVLMQVFCRKDGIICGVDEAIALLKQCSDAPHALKIHALHDGDSMTANETVMLIEGDYSTFAHLETLYLGCLARRSAVATSVKQVVDAACGRTVLFFAARFDHWLNQPGDGYAALVGGAHGVSTDANAFWIQGVGIGTIPHGLIAAYGGNTVRAAVAFDQHMPPEIQRVVLVDFENDCVRTSLEVARFLGKRLWAVRLDTAQNLQDLSVRASDTPKLGVCPELVFSVRKALDENGFNGVKIIVSGGFNAERVREFVRLEVPFDGVGVGSWFFEERIDFTADVVRVNGQPCAKVGRSFKPNPRLEEVT